MNTEEFRKNFRIIVEKIFNNWQNLRLAVEHGMGGKNGQKVAIDIMNYTYEFCINEDNITLGELQDVIEELMDQELDTICEDGSVSEICNHLLRYKQMSLLRQYDAIEAELNKLQGKEWLRPDIKVTYTPAAGDSSSEDENGSEESENDDELMDVENEHSQPSGSNYKRSHPIKQKDEFIEPEDGWTTVRNKKK